MLCPKCQTDRAHRSHRKGLKDYAVSPFGYHPYRCRDCGNRFLLASRTEPAAAATSTEKEIRATRATHAWKRKRREILLYGWALLFFLVFLYFVTRDHVAHSVPSDNG